MSTSAGITGVDLSKILCGQTHILGECEKLMNFVGAPGLPHKVYAYGGNGECNNDHRSLNALIGRVLLSRNLRQSSLVILRYFAD